MNRLDKIEYYKSCAGNSAFAVIVAVFIMILLRESVDHTTIWGIAFAFTGWERGAALYWKEQAEL